MRDDKIETGGGLQGRLGCMTFFFYGPNQYALRQQLAKMVAAYRVKAGSDFGLERVDGAVVRVQELTGVLQAAPFLATSRLVIVEGLAANKPVVEKLAGVLASVPTTTVAVFVEREVDLRTVAFKTLSKTDKVVKFEAVTGAKLLSWVRAEAVWLGGEMEGAAARELVELAGEDQWRLSEEVAKLVNYRSTVTIEAVRELVTASVERSIFELVEAMTTGKAGVALGAYRALLAQRESELYVLTMIAWQLRNLLWAKTAPAGMSPAELAGVAGMSPYVAGKMLAAQGDLSEAVLVRAYRAVGECEYDIKTGRAKAEVAVERLIYMVVSGG